jgi:uncharacterized protein YceK
MNHHRLLLIILFAISCILLVGCGTIAFRMSECFNKECRDNKAKTGIYPAVKTDIIFLTQPKNPKTPIILKGIGYIFIVADFPVSAVLDTVLLPYDLYASAKYRKYNAETAIDNTHKDNEIV